MGQTIEDDRRAMDAEAAVKIRKIEVDYEQFEVIFTFFVVFVYIFNFDSSRLCPPLT